MPPAQRRAVQFTLTSQILEGVLAFPVATTIERIIPHPRLPHAWIFFVEDPSLPEVPDGETPPTANPTLRRRHIRKGEVAAENLVKVEFLGWGLNP